MLCNGHQNCLNKYLHIGMNTENSFQLYLMLKLIELKKDQISTVYGIKNELIQGQKNNSIRIFY